MKLAFLKKLRVVFSILYFLAITVLFIDFTELIPENIYDSVLFFQFIPSLLTFINLFAIAGIGFLIIIILNLLFGRVYCSFICPLGILQDIFSFFSKKVRRLKKYRYKYLKPYRWIRYSFLGVAIIGLVSGFTLLVSFLDPYSVFGRISSGLIRPVVVKGNNLLASIFQKFDIYSFYVVDLKVQAWQVLIISVFFLLLILFFSIFKGRLYCNTICPVGTFLGLLSKFSVFKINIDKDTCTSCKLCEKVCKAGCINIPEQNIEFDRCVNCYNCLTVCPVNSIQYSPARLVHKQKQTSHSDDKVNNRRQFFALLALIFAAGKTRAQEIVVSNTATFPAKRTVAVSPPGSISIEHFNNSCTACHLCVSACPTHVLQPAYTDYGLIGFMQPVMDNHAGFCNFDCIKCSEVCPTSAIQLLDLEKKRLTQIGKAIFVKQNCIVETEGTDCGACAEHCPTKAVRMVPYQNGLVIPEVTENICIGCGACEYACPTTPYKAIYVEGNSVHELALKPEEVQQSQEVDDDFPF
ncbi:MAG: 4Fe-4S binding protein [Bacteroidales bacterium]